VAMAMMKVWEVRVRMSQRLVLVRVGVRLRTFFHSVLMTMVLVVHVAMRVL